MIISFLLIPSYFQGELLTAYELLARRFGAETKHFAASLFLVMRALAEGVRVFAASLVLATVIGASLPNLPHLGLLVDRPGRRPHADLHLRGRDRGRHLDGPDPAGDLHRRLAAGRVDAAAHDSGRLAGGRQAEAADKFQLFSFSRDLTLPFTFWSGLIGGTFLTMASHGTDQLLVQRLLTCKNLRDGQKALITSGFVVLFQFALFLLIGVMLYVFYLHTPLPALDEQRPDLPEVRRRQPAARHLGPGDRGHLRGRDVEPERVAQLARVDDRARLLQAAARPRPDRRAAAAAVALVHGRAGASS